MPNRKENLSIARNKNHKTLRPPPNLWEILDAQHKSAVPPPNSFTLIEYATRYNITQPQAAVQVERLIRSGTVVEMGRFGFRHARHFCLRT